MTDCLYTENRCPYPDVGASELLFKEWPHLTSHHNTATAVPSEQADVESASIQCFCTSNENRLICPPLTRCDPANDSEFGGLCITTSIVTSDDLPSLIGSIPLYTAHTLPISLPRSEQAPPRRILSQSFCLSGLGRVLSLEIIGNTKDLASR